MQNRRRALITGVTGQDGSYLAELLLDKGYEVHGTVRRSSSLNTARIDHLYHDRADPGRPFSLHYADLTDGTSLRRVLEATKPAEIYHLGAQSHVRVSFDVPEYTADVVGMGTLRLLEAIRDFARAHGYQPRVYNAGSSEMYGNAAAPQSVTTPFQPRSPYAVAKIAAHWHAVNYRDAYGMFVSNGILFNHESPRRGETFVTRKITRAVGRIKAGLQSTVRLGNLAARRDWGFAGDYVRAMWLMLQQDRPGDYVIATGECHTVQDFVTRAFSAAGLDPSGRVVFDDRYLRPNEVECLQGDASNARKALGWQPTVTFDGLVDMMVASDLALARGERFMQEAA